MNTRRPIACAALATLSLLFACGGGGKAPSQAPDAPPPLRLGMDVSRSASVDGVELRWWAASDDGGAVGAAIAGAMDPSPVLTGLLAGRWEESGLRLVRVPRSSFDALVASAPPVGQFAREWKGWMGAWSPVFRGASVPRPAPFMLDSRRTLLGPGAPRVLLRAWPAPTPDGPAVRLDIAFQFVEGDGSSPADIRPIDALTAELVLDPDFIYILTSERPGVVWGEAPLIEPTTSGAGPAPQAGELLTIGELLCDFQAASPESAAPRKVIVAIVPEFSGGFALLQRPGGG